VANNDTIKKTVTVTLLLCLVCSIIVSSAAVLLKPLQIANQALDAKRNVLAVAGLMEPGQSVEDIFAARVTTRVIDLNTGEFTDAVDPAAYDQRRAARDSDLSRRLSKDDDLARINRREHYSVVYLVEEEGRLQTLILPVRGFGLWSTLHGFLALKADGRTVQGLGFYEHGETPGLGGEVDNPQWRAQWTGKQVFDADGEVVIQVLKGRVDPQSPKARYQVDGLSGATLTTRGVQNLLHFWLGELGYGPFLDRLPEGEASS
jgi:Na+-transporting NADH:ubiquinone oxidoreductase subunit C